jgi:energy-coupling factor transport system substrate-specific component
MNRALSISVYVMSALLGLVALLYPFVLPTLVSAQRVAEAGASRAQSANASMLAVALVLLSLGALLLEMQGHVVDAKVVATLGVLIAVASVLRFIETAIPGPGGFSPIFVPIILAGYVFGARFGFLMGVLTLFASALITAGVGPWLPYQMLTAGWAGMSAGWLPHPSQRRLELIMLTLFVFTWGFLYGAILNLYFWPFAVGGGASSWEPGSGVRDTLARYGAFYLATSLLWDLVRGVGNGLLLLAVGAPVIAALERFRLRFQFELI